MISLSLRENSFICFQNYAVLLIKDIQRNNSAVFVLPESHYYLTAENTCTTLCQFAFPLCMCVCIPRAAAEDHGICRDAER